MNSNDHFNELNIRIRKNNTYKILNFKNFSNLKKLTFESPDNTTLLFSNDLINNLEYLNVSNVLINIENNNSKDIIKNLEYLKLNNSSFQNDNQELKFISKNLRIFKFKSNSFLLSSFPSFKYSKELKEIKFHVLEAQKSINEITQLTIQLKCHESNICIKRLNTFLIKEKENEYPNFNFSTV